MRIGIFDGEMSNLKATFGQILCWCVGDYKGNGKVNITTFRQDSYKVPFWDDKKLSKDIKEEMESYDLVVSWNGKVFDIRFLNTRLIFWGEPPTVVGQRKCKHLDLLYTSRNELCLHSNRLESVIDYYQIPVKKTKLDGHVWNKAHTGDKEAMDYVVKHCEHDVKTLGYVYEKMISLTKAIKV